MATRTGLAMALLNTVALLIPYNAIEATYHRLDTPPSERLSPPDAGRVNVFLESGGPVPVGRQLDNNFPIDALLTSSGHRV